MADTTDFAVEKPTVGGYRNSWGGTLNTGFDKLTELLALALPLGTIQMYPLATAPTATTNGGEWLLCGGGSLARVGVYAPLFALIGTTYGIGSSSDSSTFSLPDLRARVPVGYNVGAIGSGVTVRSGRAIATTADGTESHILTDTQISKHSHSITDPGHIHPIDPSTTHFHVGDQTGGKTGMKTLDITDPEHGHTVPVYTEWLSHASLYGIAFDNGPLHGDVATTNSATGISIADHDHSLTTDAKTTGITTTQTNPVRITTTNDQPDGDASHNNMQPYLVVNYIILTKHPTF